MKHNKKKKRITKKANFSKKLGITHIVILAILLLSDIVFALFEQQSWMQGNARSVLFVLTWAGWVVLIPLLFFITIGAWIACKIKKKEFFKPCKIALLADFPLGIFTFLAYCAFF